MKAVENLALADGRVMEDLCGHPRLQAADGKTQDPITLQQAIGQRIRTHCRAGHRTALTRQFTGVQLADVFALDGTGRA